MSGKYQMTLTREQIMLIAKKKGKGGKGKGC